MNAQSRKTKSSEEQIPQAPSEENFVGLVKYINEREKALSRYSNKLRESLKAIDAILQDMHISINLQDKQPFGEDNAQCYPLQLYLYLGERPRGEGLWIHAEGCDTDYGYKAFGDCSRNTLKQLVRSGRLPKFLVLVAQKMAEAEKEYSVVSAIAERMAKSIEPQDIAQNS